MDSAYATTLVVVTLLVPTALAANATSSHGLPDPCDQVDELLFDEDGRQEFHLGCLQTKYAQQIPDQIRPGAWIESPTHCTISFLVTDASGTWYALTAGHCVDPVWNPCDPECDPVSLVDGPVIGEVVSFRNAEAGNDFALVEIDPEDRPLVEPTMVGWAGPTGTATEIHDGLVKQYGFGTPTGVAHATRCRLGVSAPDAWTSGTFFYRGHGFAGDSGSPVVTDDGLALGIVRSIVVTPGGTMVEGVRLTYALSQLEADTGLDLTLQLGDPVEDVCRVT